MACEVAVLNPQMDVSAMESLYNHDSWKPLCPDLGSHIYAHSPQGSVQSVHSPSSVCSNSPVLSHVGSPMAAAAPMCCSPVSVHSPMQAAHSPIMDGSPALSDNILASVKQEFDAELRYANDSCLSSLLRNNEMIAAQNMAMAPPHMGPPHPREILDGKLVF